MNHPHSFMLAEFRCSEFNEPRAKMILINTTFRENGTPLFPLMDQLIHAAAKDCEAAGHIRGSRQIIITSVKMNWDRKSWEVLSEELRMYSTCTIVHREQTHLQHLDLETDPRGTLRTTKSRNRDEASRRMHTLHRNEYNSNHIHDHYKAFIMTSDAHILVKFVLQDGTWSKTQMSRFEVRSNGYTTAVSRPLQKSLNEAVAKACVVPWATEVVSAKVYWNPGGLEQKLEPLELLELREHEAWDQIIGIAGRGCGDLLEVTFVNRQPE
ncbi:hypothetical protein Micbo1qcDRAFT_177164 [Microdochium bolleyi]|uniref:Uncharacterized protein n=1 Tax=Microdochium bolleyi TaxID=196109 RepID=A0A136IWA1_9PEZI|nr:hypothetical protein Micbo1qcDRAFT_177164 [Microdochium bolleyi]